MQINKNISDPRIQEILKLINGGRVLDIGCVQHDPTKRSNPNWLHQHLYDKAEEVLGIDIDKNSVATLRKSGSNVVVGDAEVLDIDGKYDYIVVGELIEHLSNPGMFLTAAKRRLAESGMIIITTPNPWSWPRLKRLASPDEVHCNPEHTHYHDRRTLRQLLERHGFNTKIKFIGPMSEGITRRLFRMPVKRLKRLGATQLLAVAHLAR